MAVDERGPPELTVSTLKTGGGGGSEDGGSAKISAGGGADASGRSSDSV